MLRLTNADGTVYEYDKDADGGYVLIQSEGHAPEVIGAADLFDDCESAAQEGGRIEFVPTRGAFAPMAVN